MLKSAYLIKVERQTVSGFNYRFTIAFDSSTVAQYVIVVYQTLSGQFSVTSADFANFSSSYSFTTALTSTQVAAISYFNALQAAVSSQLSNLLTSGTVLDTVYQSSPYFQLIYHNSAY